MKNFWILLVVGIVLGYGASVALNAGTAGSTLVSVANANSPGTNITPGYSTILVPAVDEDGKGVVTNLTVQAKPGTGKVLVDINSLVFWVDTQNSIRVAGRVAESASGLKIGNYDITYSIVTNASAVEGPSAGAALTLATIAALEGRQIRSDVMITGTIEPDGSIGQVGEVLSKAQAAKELGATLFIVPEGQSIDVERTYEKKCREFLLSKFCSTEWKSVSTNVSQTAGIDIAEAGNIYDAMRLVFE